MKATTTALFVALALGASALITLAQNDGNGAPPEGAPRNGHRPPPSPVMHVLDANHDGVIDADEIANASKALLTLDKNGDGKLTQDELRPPRPQNGQRPERGQQPPADE